MNEDKKAARREAREAVFCLMYETEFHPENAPEEIFDRAVLNRDIDPDNEYIRRVYFGAMEMLECVDSIIARHAKGWRTGRLSRVSRAILRLCVYEMGYMKDIPNSVAINEAVELSKKYGEPKAKAFINGVLNAVKDELDGKAPADTVSDD